MALALVGACAGPDRGMPVPAPAAAFAVPGGSAAEPPLEAWMAAFEHLFERAGSGLDHDGTPFLYCIRISPHRASSEVIAALRERLPQHDPQTCGSGVVASRTAPDGRTAKTFWSAISPSPRHPNGWIVDSGHDDLVMHMPAWRCLLTPSATGWVVSDCRQTSS